MHFTLSFQILVSQKPHYGSGFSVMRGMVKALRNQESKRLCIVKPGSWL
ncbi:hypothetical protein XENTR_v10007773 [Xenopus tropicalis]|nr:hypothetical protein XENTR_v10007773 [Xenopus tropicalis]